MSAWGDLLSFLATRGAELLDYGLVGGISTQADTMNKIYSLISSLILESITDVWS